MLYAEHEAVLLDAARGLSVDDFEVACGHWRHAADDHLDGAEPAGQHERRHLHLSATLFGAVAIDGLLDPDGGATVLAALDALDRPDPAGGPEPSRSPAQRRTDALVDLARLALGDGERPGVTASLDVVGTVTGEMADSRGIAGGRPALGQIPSAVITATVPAALLLGRSRPRLPATRGAEFDRIGPVPHVTLERLACDATIRRVLLDPAGEVLDLGRATRVVLPAQRRALVHRDRGCAFPGCDRPHRWCDAHHLVPWTAGGPTDLHNLALLCRRHHTLVHEGRWQAHRTPDGTLQATPAARATTPGRDPP